MIIYDYVHARRRLPIVITPRLFHMLYIYSLQSRTRTYISHLKNAFLISFLSIVPPSDPPFLQLSITVHCQKSLMKHGNLHCVEVWHFPLYNLKKSIEIVYLICIRFFKNTMYSKFSKIQGLILTIYVCVYMQGIPISP